MALRTGGQYSEATIDSIEGRNDAQPRSSESASEITLRTSVLLYVLILDLLSAEWMLRKRAGMI